MVSSLPIFKRFIKRDRQGKPDVAGILSVECYHAWLQAKGVHVPLDPEDAFRKAITGHCTLEYLFSKVLAT